MVSKQIWKWDWTWDEEECVQREWELNGRKKRKWASNHVSMAHTNTHSHKKRETNRLFLTSFAFSIIFLIYCYTRFVFSPLTSAISSSSRSLLSFSMAFFLGHIYNTHSHARMWTHNRIECNIAAAAAASVSVCARFHYHLQPCFKSILSPFTLDSMALLMLDSTSARRAFTIQRAHRTHTRKNVEAKAKSVWEEENEWANINRGSRSSNKIHQQHIQLFYHNGSDIILMRAREKRASESVDWRTRTFFWDMIKRMAASQAGDESEKSPHTHSHSHK